MSVTDFRETETKGRKSGRMSARERDVLERLLPVVGLSHEQVLDKKQAFGREAPLFLEVGFGRGTFLLEQAVLAPESDFIGVEIYRPAISRLLKGLEGGEGDAGLPITNVRVYNHNAKYVLMDCIPEHYLDGVYILFPDPWPKKKHQKRRLIDQDFCVLLLSRLKPGADVIVATDHAGYAEEIEHVFESSGFILESKDVSDTWTTAYAMKALKKKNGHRTYRYVRP